MEVTTPVRITAGGPVKQETPLRHIEPPSAEQTVPAEAPATPTVDQDRCVPRAGADFAADGCRFPDKTTAPEAAEADNQASNGTGDNTIPKDSALWAMLEGPEFGQREPDIGEALQERQDDLQTPEARQSALTAAAQAAELPEAVQQQAQALVAALPPEKQAEATASLEHLFKQRGKELGAERVGALLAQLQEMNGRSYDARAGSAADLVVSALHDIAAPTDIDQGVNTGTCSATSMQIALAQTKPERYLKMVDTLAQNKSFEGFAPNWTFTQEGAPDGEQAYLETNRSPAARLVQNAIMDSANGAEAYSSATKMGDRPQMADEAWVAQTLPRVLGSDEPYAMLHLDDDKDEYPDSDTVRNLPKEQLYSALKDYGPSPDRPVVMSYFDPKHGTGHAVLITGLENDRVRYVDPIDGVTKTISQEEFQERVWSINVPVSAMPAR
ncbi:MAG: papain-like cysteine protease family protein [Candidatus Sericytochromatia bacterium]